MIKVKIGTVDRAYTVVGLYPDSEWGQGMREAVFVEHVEAGRDEEAIGLALEKMAAQSGFDVEELEVLALFKGHLMDFSHSALAGAVMTKVVFHPQAWVNDYAIAVDPEGPTEFEVGIIFGGIGDDTYESDELRFHENAPQWVKDWAGPFYIEVKS